MVFAMAIDIHLSHNSCHGIKQQAQLASSLLLLPTFLILLNLLHALLLHGARLGAALQVCKHAKQVREVTHRYTIPKTNKVKTFFSPRVSQHRAKWWSKIAAVPCETQIHLMLLLLWLSIIGMLLIKVMINMTTIIIGIITISVVVITTVTAHVSRNKRGQGECMLQSYPFAMPSAMHPEAVEGGAIRGHGRAWAVLLAPLPLPLMPLTCKDEEEEEAQSQLRSADTTFSTAVATGARQYS